MSNLLRLIVGLAEDGAVRAAFRDDPVGALVGFADLSGEDVAAALDVARVQVAPSVADRLTDTLAASLGRGETPRDVAIRSLLALCDSVDGVGVLGARGASGGRDASSTTGSEIPDHPPGVERPVHLWAVGGGADDGEPDQPWGAPEAARLSPVPDPPGGFEFNVLELVQLPEGLPDAGIEPGTEATIVAVHREPELSYEIEISDEAGGRLFLGIVPTSAVGPTC